MGREFELKYRADAQTIAAIREAYGNFEEIRMQTTYYDTPDQKLRSLRWSLRQRMENDVAVCNLKIPMPDGSRGEWETKSADLLSGIRTLCQQGAPAELLTLAEGGLTSICGARFLRLAKTIVLENAAVELALDQGILMGGGREELLCEVEVESKAGADEATIAFAADLARAFSLTEAHETKFHRALMLAQQ